MMIIKYEAATTAISDHRYASTIIITIIIITITIIGGSSKKWRNGV
jgi:hypothetical protein